MKKGILLFLAVLALSGVAWAQVGPGIDHPFDVLGPPAILGFGPIMSVGALFDVFSAVPTVSTEARYSAWRYGSDIDDYIDVNFYDPNIGTFFFLGGFPSTTNVDSTGVLTGNDYTISFGLGKTLKSFYLGAYYGGGLVNAWGVSDNLSPVSKYSGYAWRNNLALLLGTHGYGAFRLDMVLDTDTESLKSGGDLVAKAREYAPSFALTWGGIQLAGMDPYITIGFGFPDKYTWGDGDGKTLTYTERAIFALQAGVNYDLSDSSSLSGDLVIGGLFGSRLKGDKEAEPVYFAGASGKYDIKEGGAFGIGLKAGYAKKFDFGKFGMGVKPKVAIGYSRNNRSISGDVTQKNPSDNMFELYSSLDLGFKFQANSKVALFTGASLQLFDYTRFSHSGGNSKNKTKAWALTGIGWDSTAWAMNNNGGPSNILGFGMTVTPVKNLVIGCGLNTFMDKLFTVNLRDMQVDTGDYWDDAASANNFVGALGELFNNLKFDLTVSYKF